MTPNVHMISLLRVGGGGGWWNVLDLDRGDGVQLCIHSQLKNCTLLKVYGTWILSLYGKINNSQILYLKFTLVTKFYLSPKVSTGVLSQALMDMRRVEKNSPPCVHVPSWVPTSLWSSLFHTETGRRCRQQGEQGVNKAKKLPVWHLRGEVWGGSGNLLALLNLSFFFVT